MRKTKLTGILSLCLLCSGVVLAQQVKKETAPPIRCGTEIVIEEQFRKNPALKAEYDKKVAEAANATSTNRTARLSALTGPVTIPVVVHVVLPYPEIITEEQIDYLINRLNLDFSGLNPDSTNGVAFYPVRGHSLLRFTRARRTPAGAITNGLERRVGNIQIPGTTYQPIKHTSDGGLDPWDVTQYYNIWVGQSIPLAGIAPAIGVGAQTETTSSTTGIDGVCLNFQYFSNGCFADPTSALGRTPVHEIGHNFGLYHNFSGCAPGADFGQPTPAGQTLPANLVGAGADDTPGQSVDNLGLCPTGIVASNCDTSLAPNPPGKMYQNYMDYTNDPCMSLFTKNQVARMEYMLETYRPGYLTTQGANPPAGYPALDAGFDGTVSPNIGIFNNAQCTISLFPAPPVCPGSFIPAVSITNYGATTIMAVTATVTVGGVTSAAITFPVNLITNRKAVISFPAQNLIAGINNIIFNIISVNGSPDAYTANNVISTVINLTPLPLPFAQNFVTTTFPPPNMYIFNPNGNFTWQYSAAGNGNAGSAFINNFSNSGRRQIDDLRTLPLAPPTGASSSDSMIISFDVAHKNYGSSRDSLVVLVSTNCGTSFTSVYVKAADVLATAGSSNNSYTTPVAGDWRRERISLPGSFLTGGSIIVAFRNINDYGNNIFLDNINVDALVIVRRDLQLVSINQPGPVTCSSITPSVTVRNRGTDTITGFKVNHVINTGTPVVTNVTGVSLVPNASLTVSLTGATFPAPGAYTFRAYTYDPVTTSGNTDQNRSNDTLVRTVQVVGTQAAPLVEGFEGPTFPPAGWVLTNPDGGITWQRTTAAARTGGASAFINNFNYTSNGPRDELYTPQITYNSIGNSIDSVSVAFDVAALTYSYPGSTAIPLDTLEVLATGDCGATYTSVYKKWGNELQTVNDPNFSQPLEFIPNSRNQWRREVIDLTAFVNRSSVQLVFRNTTNFENNIYLDNINLSTKTLPAKLKQDGYLIYPSPFASTFTIQHYLSPTELRGVAVYNSIGQRVFAQTYGAGGASAFMQVDMSRYASGLYTVVLRYTNRTISQKIIKQP